MSDRSCVTSSSESPRHGVNSIPELEFVGNWNCLFKKMELELMKLELKFATKIFNPQINLPFNSEIILPWQSYLEYKLLWVGIPNRYFEYIFWVPTWISDIAWRYIKVCALLACKSRESRFACASVNFSYWSVLWMHKATGCKQDHTEQSAEDTSLCTQSSTGCPEQLGLFRKTHDRHGVN